MLLVSIADKRHNARATLRDAIAEGGDSVFGRFSAPREQTLENYQNLLRVYERGAADPRRGPLVEDLRNNLEASRRV